MRWGGLALVKFIWVSQFLRWLLLDLQVGMECGPMKGTLIPPAGWGFYWRSSVWHRASFIRLWGTTQQPPKKNHKNVRRQWKRLWSPGPAISQPVLNAFICQSFTYLSDSDCKIGFDIDCLCQSESLPSSTGCHCAYSCALNDPLLVSWLLSTYLALSVNLPLVQAIMTVLLQ